MRTRLIAWLVLWLATGFVQAADGSTLLHTLSQQLARSPVVRAHVMQLKHLAILRNPIRSEGAMVFDRDRGLYWMLSAPFASETVVTRDALVQITDGQRRVMTAAQQPALAGIAGAFFPILAGDMQALQQAFTVQATGDAQHWELTLTPRDEPLNRFIATLHLSGRDDLERILITDLNGDVTDMQFSAVNREPASLSDEERAHFVVE